MWPLPRSFSGRDPLTQGVIGAQRGTAGHNACRALRLWAGKALGVLPLAGCGKGEGTTRE